MKFANYLLIILALSFLSIGSSSWGKPENTSGWPRVYHNGPTTGMYVALTFDDAPSASTAELLTVLDQLDVPATFFIEGIFASWHPDLLKAIASCDFEIGNHTYDHPKMSAVSDEEKANQLDGANRIIKEITGITPHLFRPPGGDYNQRVAEVAFGRQMTTVLWTVACADYLEPPTATIVKKVLAATKPGGIILLHDGIKHTREALPEIVNTLRSRGYTFITVGEMLKMTNGPCQWGDSLADAPSDVSSQGVF